MAFSRSSKARLTSHDLDRFASGSLFDRIARAVCGAGCLPRKELYEAWEVARRARRLFRGGRVVDLGAGHGLLAQIMLQAIGDGVITTDAHGQVEYLNPVAESLTGWTSRDARGVPLDRVFHIINEQTRRAVENPATRALREGRIVGLANHTVLVARDGTERPIDDSAAPVRDGQGRVVVVAAGLLGRACRAEALPGCELILVAEAQRAFEVDAGTDVPGAQLGVPQGFGRGIDREPVHAQFDGGQTAARTGNGGAKRHRRVSQERRRGIDDQTHIATGADRPDGTDPAEGGYDAGEHGPRLVYSLNMSSPIGK